MSLSSCVGSSRCFRLEQQLCQDLIRHIIQLRHNAHVRGRWPRRARITVRVVCSLAAANAARQTQPLLTKHRFLPFGRPSKSFAFWRTSPPLNEPAVICLPACQNWRRQSSKSGRLDRSQTKKRIIEWPEHESIDIRLRNFRCVDPLVGKSPEPPPLPPTTIARENHGEGW